MISQLARENILWESPDFNIGVMDDLMNQVLYNDSRSDAVFLHNNLHW